MLLREAEGSGLPADWQPGVPLPSDAAVRESRLWYPPGHVPQPEARGSFVLLGDIFKARPVTEGDDRFVFVEPSNENRDTQGERIFQVALRKAWPHYQHYGNVDLDHLSLLGPSMGLSLDESRLNEVGLPQELVRESPLVFKARIYRGEGPRYEKANGFWEDLTVKGRRFLPSIAGDYTPGGRECTADGCDIRDLVWKNTAFASLPFLPVNRTVKAISLSPVDFAKALTVGYSTDSATLTGADALRRESLSGAVQSLPGGQPDDHDAAIARYLAGIGKGTCDHVKAEAFEGAPNEAIARIREHFRKCEGMAAEAADSATQRTVALVAHHTQASKTKRVAAAA